MLTIFGHMIQHFKFKTSRTITSSSLTNISRNTLYNIS